VERIEPGIIADEFVLLLSKEIFYRGYGTFYFNDKCNDILKMENDRCCKQKDYDKLREGFINGEEFGMEYVLMQELFEKP
jgi:hypothetical protein